MSIDKIVVKQAGRHSDCVRGRQPGEEYPDSSIQKQRETRKRNLLNGKPTTANGWKSPRAMAALKARREARKQ